MAVYLTLSAKICIFYTVYVMNYRPLTLTEAIPPLDLATLDAAAAFVSAGTAANTVRGYRPHRPCRADGVASRDPHRAGRRLGRA